MWKGGRICTCRQTLCSRRVVPHATLHCGTTQGRLCGWWLSAWQSQTRRSRMLTYAHLQTPQFSASGTCLCTGQATGKPPCGGTKGRLHASTQAHRGSSKNIECNITGATQRTIDVGCVKIRARKILSAGAAHLSEPDKSINESTFSQAGNGCQKSKTPALTPMAYHISRKPWTPVDMGEETRHTYTIGVQVDGGDVLEGGGGGSQVLLSKSQHNPRVTLIMRFLGDCNIGISSITKLCCQTSSVCR